MLKRPRMAKGWTLIDPGLHALRALNPPRRAESEARNRGGDSESLERPKHDEEGEQDPHIAELRGDGHEVRRRGQEFFTRNPPGSGRGPFGVSGSTAALASRTA